MVNCLSELLAFVEEFSGLCLIAFITQVAIHMAFLTCRCVLNSLVACGALLQRNGAVFLLLYLIITEVICLILALGIVAAFLSFELLWLNVVVVAVAPTVSPPPASIVGFMSTTPYGDHIKNPPSTELTSQKCGMS